MRAVDVLVHLTTARFDRALTYSVPDPSTALGAGWPALRVGEIVRVPLGSRDVFAFVVTAERDVTDPAMQAARRRRAHRCAARVR